MNVTDIFIKRPVLATVVSLMILALGLKAMGSLPIMQYPFTQNAVVTVSTAYTGAHPSIIAGFLTTPLENSVSQANGVDYMTSSNGQHQYQWRKLCAAISLSAVRISLKSTRLNPYLKSRYRHQCGRQ